jgi:hypothetical protein
MDASGKVPFELGVAGGERVDSLAAYEQVLPELAGVADEALVPINVDIMLAVTTVLGALPEIRQFRSDLVSKLPAFDIARFDKLELYARAAGHAHALHLQLSALPDVTPLVEAAEALRELLVSDASALGRRGLIDAQVLSSLKGPVGHRNLAFDLSALSSVLRASWSRIEGKSAIALEELDRARLLADQLLTVVGLREQGPASPSASAIHRQRAFTLLVQSYNEARRALGYLRWDEDDLEAIAPSLYGQQRPSRRRSSEPAPTVAPQTASAAAPSNGARAAASSTGLPGESPFDEP